MITTTLKILCILSLFSFVACSPSLTPFTERIHNELDFSEDDLQKIQFYLSEDIVLTRNLGGEESRITDGKIKVVNGREVEEIVFEKGTPGILLFTPKRERLAISFEVGGNDKYLMFGPNERAGGRYVLLAKEWRKSRGKVSYNGKTYETGSSSAYSSLMVDIDKYRKVSYQSSKAKGRKVRS
jgi:hypothetical protein